MPASVKKEVYRPRIVMKPMYLGLKKKINQGE